MQDKIFLKIDKENVSENLISKEANCDFLSAFDDKERQLIVAKNMDKYAEYLWTFDIEKWCFPFIIKLMLTNPDIVNVDVEKMTICLTKAYTKKLNGDFVNTKDEIPEMIVYAVEEYLNN